MKINRVILSGGGTGGHIYPALALYRRMKTLNPQLEVLYIGTPNGLEAQIVPKEGIDFAAIEVQGLRRSLSWENFKSLYLYLSSTVKAKKLIRDFQPDVVIGTGGYACAPVIRAANQLGLPTAIHEQNSVAGLTNKLLAKRSSKIFLAFEAAGSDFSAYADKLEVVGNPRGQEVIETQAQFSILSDQFALDDQTPTVLVFGGSRGAPGINQAAVAALPHFEAADYQVIIATGRDHYQDIVDQVGQPLSDNVRLVEYIDAMPQVFQAIDLVLCRSGATTLTELTALGLASVLIPSPYVTNNHQEANAQSLVDRGASVMIREADLSGDKLFEVVDELMQAPEKLEAMADAARQLGIRDSSDRMIQTLEELL